VPDHIILYGLLLVLEEDPFLNPPDWLPPLELDEDLVGIDGLDEVEEDVSLDGVSCEVEGLINLDECAWHIKDILIIKDLSCRNGDNSTINYMLSYWFPMLLLSPLIKICPMFDKDYDALIKQHELLVK